AGRGYRAVATKEPSTGPIGAVLRQALSHRLVYPPSEPMTDEVMALLYAADRLDHIRADILPRIEKGIHVVCDRYRLSSYAYQGLTAGQGWVHELNSRSIAPDLTLFIDVPPEVSQSRIIARGGHIELYETEERLRPIYGNYLRLVQEAQEAGERIIVIDGTPAPEVVAAAILERVVAVIEEEGR
ncbi:MAG: dTMP kinase, partial [Chloroflexota bacterium]|nr:dTMP kinase [Chloroflexota bacterium]